jgi:hypothetical protein
LLKGRCLEAALADLGLALGITIFSKSTAHGHFLEDLASKLFNLFNDVPEVFPKALLRPDLNSFFPMISFCSLTLFFFAFVLLL